MPRLQNCGNCIQGLGIPLYVLANANGPALLASQTPWMAFNSAVRPRGMFSHFSESNNRLETPLEPQWLGSFFRWRGLQTSEDKE